jgi:vacuolar-type H+-ATPase catalytic subunit A/Vma1
MRYILLIVLFLVSNTFLAQSAFDKYDGQEDVTSIVVNKKMFQMMGNVKVDANDKETQQYLDLMKKLDSLKVFTTTSTKVSAEMKLSAEKYIKTAGLEELMRINDGGKNIRILVKSGETESQVKELLMFIEGANPENETVLMSLLGDFSLNEISILTDKMRIPGGDDLKKATKGKG